MAGQMEFMEAIQELLRIAQTNGNQLSMDEITNYFMDMELDDKKLDFICKYYEAQGIVILNRVEKLEEDLIEEEILTKEDPLDNEMVAIYMKEAKNAKTLTEEQMESMVVLMLDGDEMAKESLVEANLSLAIETAKNYKGKGMLLSDLIQEANIGLMMAVATYEPESDAGILAYIRGMMQKQIEESLEEYNSSTRSAMKMATRINELNDVATAFAKEYDREAKPEELAKRMGISEEEVRELMKVSLDAIAFVDESKMGN
ncbi:MAG: sigma-70 domain-containing protein [Eubacteriales bacterium]|nr:sigma-70 domain-containing protein [Eubacteriales bacterium]